MAAFAQALTQGLGRAGNEYGQARAGLLDEKLKLLQSSVALQQLQQGIEQSKASLDPGYMIEKRIAAAPKIGLKPGTYDFLQFVANGKLPSTATLKSLQKNVLGSDVSKTYPGIVTPTGEPLEPGKNYDVFESPDGSPVAMISGQSMGATSPRPFNYVGPDGAPHKGFTIGMQEYGDDGQPLPPNTQVFSAWMQPLTTTTEGFQQVVQPDGSIRLVPTETTSTRVRGAQPGPPGLPAPQGTLPGPPKPSPARVKGQGTVVGGRVPPQVAKSYETYNGAQERFAVMQDALPRALQGDQQAMLNLLANHVGMTVGLQRGGRITEGLYTEAQRSSPVLARFAAKFDDKGDFSLDPRDYRGGVILTSDQMRQMIDLAKVRLDQDYQAWQREISAAKSGYGMTGNAGDAGGGPPGPWNNY